MLACRAASPAAPTTPPSRPSAAGPAGVLPYQLRRWAAMVSRSACPAAIMASAAAPRATTEIDWACTAYWAAAIRRPGSPDISR